jgi:hypothetical protein
MPAAPRRRNIAGVTTTTAVVDTGLDRPPHRLARRIGWGSMTVLSLAVGAYAIFLVATGFRFVPASVSGNGFPTALGLRTHIAAAGLSLVAGPFQFLRPLRGRFPVAHHGIGAVYIVAALVGGTAAGLIALFTTGGPVAGVGFLAGAVAWLACTIVALVAVKRHDFLAHQRWMVRSWAIAFGAVTLRLYLPGAMAAGFEFAQVYPYVAWLCWVPNLLVAQLFVRRARGAADF